VRQSITDMMQRARSKPASTRTCRTTRSSMHPEEYREAGNRGKNSRRQAVLSVLIFAALWEALVVSCAGAGNSRFRHPQF